MSDFPQSPVLPLFVGTFSRWAAGATLAQLGATVIPSPLTWTVADTAYYIPVWLPWPYPVARVWWYNGSSTTTTNLDFGIYTADGSQIYHTGVTAEGSANTSQYVTPSPGFILPPGGYYFALACSSTTSGRGGSGATSAVTSLREVGVLQQATAMPLPATMAGGAVANALIPFCGITRTTTGF